MKFKRTYWISWTIPGTGIEIIEFTVMKEKSSKQFQMCWMKTENPKLTTMFSLIYNWPSLKVLASPAFSAEIQGGNSLIWNVPLGKFVS